MAKKKNTPRRTFWRKNKKTGEKELVCNKCWEIANQFCCSEAYDCCDCSGCGEE
ncbi:MAG: hypothetical protein HRT98_04445 [Mycoplasmatales bacterium]|nr:hypothetical protein [Mycoplasmatales bacterium]